MGDLVHRFCNTGGLEDITGWVRDAGDPNAFSTLSTDCSVYKKVNATGEINYFNIKILDYGVDPRYFSGSMDMKRRSITDRGLFGFHFLKSDEGNYSYPCATVGGLALYGYDDDNTDLYYYAWNQSLGGCHSKYFYLVNLESIGINPYVYHTYRFMADLEAQGSYGYYDGVTIDGIGTVCPPHTNDGIVDIYGVGNIWHSTVWGYDNNSEEAWGGKNLTAYNVTGDKKFNKFPKWRKTSAGMRPTY